MVLVISGVSMVKVPLCGKIVERATIDFKPSSDKFAPEAISMVAAPGLYARLVPGDTVNYNGRELKLV